MTEIAALLEDLEAEQRELRDVVAALTPDEWLTPTPAWGWDVRDTIAHLADTDELAIGTATGGDYALNGEAARAASGEDVTYHGVLRGRRRSGAEVGEWWGRTSAAVRATLGALPADARIPWGIGMRTPSLITARMMETWAHGLDCFAATGIEPVDTPRLRRIAGLALRALPYAFEVAGKVAPPDVRGVALDLTGPDGERWWIGPERGRDIIAGSASEWCRVATRRVRPEATSLQVTTPLAAEALKVARAYLADSTS